MDEDPEINEDSDMDEDSRNERTLQELLLYVVLQLEGMQHGATFSLL
jgi:hypothetical protein